MVLADHSHDRPAPDPPALHSWRISDREIARHEGRRGHRHAYRHLRPRHSALVVVDMVDFFVGSGGYQQGIVPNINRLAAGLRAAGGTVAWVTPGQTPITDTTLEFLGPQVAELYRQSGGTGPLRQRLWHGLAVDDADLIVEKFASSAFFPGRCKLDDQLRSRDVDTVWIAGTVANVCCESSARDASTLGYRTTMVADANAARFDQELNATLHTIYRSFGDVRPTDDLLVLLAQASARA